MANASTNSRAHVDERDAKRLYSIEGAGLLPVTGAACRKMLQKPGCDFTKPLGGIPSCRNTLCDESQIASVLPVVSKSSGEQGGKFN